MKFNHSNSQFNQALLATYTDPNLSGLIFGFLKRANIQPSHPDRDDLVQECHLAAAQALIDFEQRADVLTMKRSTFIYQRLSWCLGKYFERGNRDYQRAAIKLDQPLTNTPSQTHPDLCYEYDFETREAAIQLVHQALAQAAPMQRKFLRLLLKDPGLTNNELAKRLNITPQAVSYHRKQIVKLLETLRSE